MIGVLHRRRTAAPPVDPGAPGPTLGGTGVGTVPSVPGGAVNVMTAHGAVGNGTTDDGPAIRAAVAAAGTNGTVYFPAGTYRYVPSGVLGLPGGITLLGAGQTQSIINYEPTAGYQPLAFANSGANNITWHSLAIKRNTAQALVMFPIQAGRSGWTFDNCLLDGNYLLGSIGDTHLLQIGLTGTTQGLNLLNSTFTRWRFPLFMSSLDTGTVDGVEVRNCYFFDNYLSELEFNSPAGLITNVTVENNTLSTNFGPPSGGFGVGFAHVTDSVIRYNLIEDHQQEGVHIEDRCDNILVEYNQLIQTGKNRYSGVQIINASQNVTVQHNVIDGTGTKDAEYIAAIAALQGGGTSKPLNIVIDDNTIDRGTNDGIFHECIGVTITNNRFQPSVDIFNGGSSGTITVTNNTVSSALPAGFPGTGGGGGGSAPTISSVTTRASAGVINVTASVGDTLVACVGAENSTPTISGAVTWTTRATGTGGGYPHNVKIFTGPVTSGGTQAVTIGGSGTVDAAVYVLAGGVTVDATAAGGASGATSQTVSGMTTTTANTLLLGVWGTQFGSATATAAYTPPSGMTEQADLRSADFSLLGSFSEALTAAGAVSRTATASHAGLGWSGALIALASA